MLKEGILLDVTENDEKSKKAIAYYEAEYAMEKNKDGLIVDLRKPSMIM